MSRDPLNVDGRLVEVAVTLPVRGTYTYRFPEALDASPCTGMRVMVPFGARRVTGYVLSVDALAPAVDDDDQADGGPALREVGDLLAGAAAFDEDMLAFFRWVADYYHAPLGEVIRTGLPSALGVPSTVRARLTPLGRSAASMPGAERALGVLHDSARGDLEARWLLRSAGATMSRLLALERQGYVELRREEANGDRGQRTERAAVFVMQVPLPAHANRAAEVLRRVARAREVLVSELREQMGDVSAQLRSLESRGAIRLESRRVFRTPHGAFVDSGEVASVDPPRLTPGQKKVTETVLRSLGKGYEGFLLHGVTGSGKTEVYLRLIARTVEQSGGAIVLVPEIALTPQLVGRFRARFGERIALLHSALSPGERLDQWEQVRRGRLPIVVGARSAVFAPVPRLGLIVVDEEHEPTFKQEDQLRYHARDLAIVRARLAKATVVLGSATPSLESTYNTHRGKLTLLSMPERVHARPLPQVTLIDLCRTPTTDAEGVLSEPLVRALEENVARGEQSLLFLNRRGYASFLLCRSCGFILECPHCSISLTYHHASRRLVCHYCDHRRRLPERCGKCSGTLIQPMGVGTEKVEAALRLLLPKARLARMDRDTTRGPALGQILRAFHAREKDVLVGTQMIAKGHDFPGVTLVGVLLADQALKFPDFRAAERTFQLLTQVAGRAGRGERPGRVLVQTFDPRHYALRHASHHDYAGFVDTELAIRRERGFPPFLYLALLRITATDADVARREAEHAARIVLGSTLRRSIGVLGPSPAPIERIKGRTRWHVLLRSPSRRALHEALRHLRTGLEGRRGRSSSVAIDVDPVSML